jgi:hypothetical protein
MNLASEFAVLGLGPQRQPSDFCAELPCDPVVRRQAVEHQLMPSGDPPMFATSGRNLQSRQDSICSNRR